MKKKDFQNLSNYKRITLQSVIVIIAVGLILFVFLHSIEYTFGIVDVTAYLTGAVAIVTLVNFSASIDKVNEYHERTLKISKDQYSFNVVAEVHKDYIKNSFSAVRKMDAELQLSDLPITDLMEHFKECPTNESDMVQVLNFFEHISLLIEWGQVDEKIIKGNFKTLFIRTHRLAKNYIEKQQNQISHTIWCSYCSMALKWEQE